jgi:RHS repeat-associated protein
LACVYDENGDQQYVNLLGADVFGKYVPDDAEYYYYVKDHLGSTRVVVDGSGNPKEAYEYYPFGKIARSTTSAGINVDEKFTGKELDDDNNERIYYFGRRYYDGDLGKWLSADPSAYKRPELSPYNYVQNNPINRIDPDGREDWWAALEAGLRTVGGATAWAGGVAGIIASLGSSEFTFGTSVMSTMKCRVIPECFYRESTFIN